NPDFGEAVWDEYFVYQASVPRITAVNPNQGPKQGGYYVTVLGEDFRPGLVVYFGQEGLRVEEITITEDLCSVRVYVYRDEHRTAGRVDVRVVNPDGAEAVLKNGFTYTSPASNPTIAGVTPDKGPTTGGIWVTISGTDLREEARVYFGGREASRVRFIDNQTLLVLIPAHPEGTVAVTVVNYDGGTDTWDKPFTYVTPVSSPHIDRVVPNKGPHVGGTSITIYGLDFRSGAAVYIDGVPAKEVVWVSYKEITCVTPGGKPGKVDVTVVNPDQDAYGAYTAPNAFTYVEVEVPTITGVEPDRGPKKGGTAITITGTGFASGARVCIGGKEALEVRVAGGTQITAVTPPGEPGRQDVRVENPDGGYAVLEDGFLYLGPPEEPGWLSASPVDERTVELEWEEVEFATAYEIFVAREDGGPYAFLDRTTATTYYATGLVPDQEYFFRVRAVNDQGISVLSEETWSWTDEAEEDEEDEASVPEERLEGNILYVTLTNGYAWRNLGSTLDLTQTAHAGAGGLLLRVPVDVALAYGRSLRVVGLRYSVEIPSAVFAPAQARRLSSAERAESALVLQLEEVPAAEAADLARQAPGRVISRMLRLTLRLEGAGNRSVLSDLGSYAPVTVAVDPNLARGRTVGLYRYRPERGWERLGGQPSPGWPQVIGAGNLTGIFAAVAETR
ncbi:MAG: IPT/TIG domain-containing protein, partial [Clostridia bacterium]|nr:IPT/TIG domain-containing protein [Clostridia bacterium]